MAGVDYLYNELSKSWEPVQTAYWSDSLHGYYVLIGTLKGYGTIHTYPPDSLVLAQRYY